MTTTELNLTATYVTALATQPDANEKIKMLLQSLFSSYEKKDRFSVQQTEKKNISSIITFSQKEISDMDKTFKKEFIANGLAAHVLKRKKYKNCISYVIRYRRNGYNIFVCSNSLEKAKELFIKATTPENIEKYRTKQFSFAKNSFLSVGTEWLRSKEGKIDPRTLRDYTMNCETRVFPKIGHKPVSELRTSDFTDILNGEKGRVIETLQTIFKGIMSYAMANGDITYNPMQAVKFRKIARKNRRALTKEEEKTFFERIELPQFAEYKPFFLLQYYFGLRPWELTDFRFEGDFLIALNAKHEKDGEKVYKKIPVPPQLKNHLDISAVYDYKSRTDVLNRVFKRLMNDETVTQYYLRHTFSTTCQQFVRPDIVKIWMGDSPESLVGRVYTHFPDDFMREQMKLVKFFA